MGSGTRLGMAVPGQRCEGARDWVCHYIHRLLGAVGLRSEMRNSPCLTLTWLQVPASIMLEQSLSFIVLAHTLQLKTPIWHKSQHSGLCLSLVFSCQWDLQPCGTLSFILCELWRWPLFLCKGCCDVDAGQD